MGLVRAAGAAASTLMGDQWREYFYCNSLDNDTLMVKGQKKIGPKSSNTKGADNIISNGALIAVNDGQCMIIVEQGAIVEVSAEPGEFIFDSSSEPSIFYGSLGENLVNSFKTFVKRFAFGGDTAKDQRIYYFNTKEIVGNKYGTANPVPFRVLDKNIDLDIEIALRAHGEFTYRLMDPILFYKNLAGNVEKDYKKQEIESQLCSELLTKLQPAFARIAESGVRYYQITAHTDELGQILNELLSKSWGEHYGIEMTAFGMSSVTAPDKDIETIKELQKNAVFRNPTMAAANLTSAQADAMRAAASRDEHGESGRRIQCRKPLCHGWKQWEPDGGAECAREQQWHGRKRRPGRSGTGIRMDLSEVRTRREFRKVLFRVRDTEGRGLDLPGMRTRRQYGKVLYGMRP